MHTFERLESNVRSYCRSFPTVFTEAEGSLLRDEAGKEYIDFFAGAGALNYGHNPPALKDRLIEYISSGGITHSLDMATAAKRTFLETFERSILEPRNLNYKVMFPGPTGTNSVESALKLARLVTGRSNVIAFTNAFHGMTLGALAVTGNSGKREGAGVPLSNVSRIPFHGYMGGDLDTIDLLEQHLSNTSSGVDHPAALILETVQAEGGVNVASNPWMRRLQRVLKKHDILLIVDDIQVGCGRTGTFFSFEKADLQPDIICLSKSLSGYGIPFSVTLMRPELDIWEPGKHNGTFRGHNLAFVTATAAIDEFWQDAELTRTVDRKARLIRNTLDQLGEAYQAKVRGRGMIQGIEFQDKDLASAISQDVFARGIIVETAGPSDEVLKILPALTIDDSQLQYGLDVISECVADQVASGRSR
ncbi:MAG: diaminobutyrate--2-oxoglutarate transaminase [Pirellulaceae bacterium]